MRYSTTSFQDASPRRCLAGTTFAEAKVILSGPVSARGITTTESLTEEVSLHAFCSGVPLLQEKRKRTIAESNNAETFFMSFHLFELLPKNKIAFTFSINGCFFLRGNKFFSS